jgi:methyl-accepting chemotaxis protein
MTWFITKLKISYRLLVISLAYTVPTGVLLYFLLASINESLRFSQFEVVGNQYQRPLESLLQLIPEHAEEIRGYNAGEPGAREKILSKQVLVDQALDNLTTVHRSFGEQLQFTDEGLGKRSRDHLQLSTLQAEWQSLKQSVFDLSSEDAMERSKHLISDIRGMITHAGDTSNLILDPDLDSYYLMDVTLLALPQTQDRISEIIRYLDHVKTGSPLTSAQRMQIAVYAAMLQESDINRVVASAQTALKEDQNFYGVSESLQKNLPRALQQYMEESSALVHMLQTISLGENEPFSSAPILSQALLARKQAFVFWEIAVDELDRLLKVRVDFYSNKRLTALVVSCVVFLLSSIVVWLITRSITHPLNSIMMRLDASSIGVDGVAREVAQSSHSLAKASADQAASVQESVASMTEMTSMVAQTVEYARECLSLAKGVGEQTERGRNIMERMVTAMQSIHTANGKLQEMARIISEISSKTTIINDIVFKTQLLSFNASIEAARAGQHGRGFAVVAEEVGKLAEMSGTAAKEIEALLNESKRQVNEIVEHNKERVGEGQSVSAEALQKFNDIAHAIQQMSSQIQSINDAAREQEAGIHQSHIAMSEMDRTAQGTNQVAIQASQYVTTLTDESTKLKRLIEGLKILIHGNRIVVHQSVEGVAGSDGVGSGRRGKSETSIVELNRAGYPGELSEIATRLASRQLGNQTETYPSGDLTGDDDSFAPLR